MIPILPGITNEDTGPRRNTSWDSRHNTSYWSYTTWLYFRPNSNLWCSTGNAFLDG